MTAMPPLRDILNNTPVNAIDVDFNFNTIEAHMGSEVINRDGSVAMTAPLTTQPPAVAAHAATKAYVDAILPVGMMAPYAGQIAPGGWAMCDGTVKSQTDPAYAALFAVIGNLYNTGGEGVGNFRLPDMQGRVAVGKWSGNVAIDTIGKKAGAYDAVVPVHQHTITNHYHIMPHTHTINHVAHGIDHTHSLSAHTHEQAVITMVDNAEGTSDYAVQSGGVYNFSANAHKQTYGPSTDSTGPSSPPWTGAADDRGTSQPSNPNTDWGGTPNTNNAGVSPTNANMQPCTTINYIVRIG